MSVSAVAPTPFYQDPDRLQIGMPQAAAEDNGKTADGKHLSMFAEGDDSPSFWDVLDIINPLQHIPIVSDIYQELTGDRIGVAARVAGGTLFGGPIGLVASLMDCSVEESTGKDAGGHVLALFQDDQPAVPGEAPATQLAAAAPVPQTVAPQTAVPTTAVSAKPPEAASVPAAPVIGLPDAAASASAPAAKARTAIYSLDGASATATPAAQAAPAPAAVAVSPLAQPARLMPAPARTNVDPRNAPLLTVPVSSSLGRSNIPVASRAADTAGAQRLVANQNVPADHPMVPPADAAGQTAASPDWFSSAWSEALDKYQRANRRNDALTGSQSVN